VLVINDNNLKLLKMKEKLLEVTIDNSQNTILEDYSSLAKEIDSEVYETLVDKIKTTDYHNQTLEEQLAFLSEIENEYVEINELQYKFKNIYERHSNKKLRLSNLECISIEEIRERISTISCYLYNLQKIEDNNKELSTLSDNLIVEEQKRISIGNRLKELDKELLENSLKAEGRIYNENADIEYISVSKEYEYFGLKLAELLNDGELLGKTLKEVESKKDEQIELLKTAEICYNNIPSNDNKNLYDSINKETTKVKYEFLLLEIASLLYKVTDEYEKSRNKRIKLEKKINDRAVCLKELGVKFSIDPFKRMRINEQLSVIESLGDNNKNILNIRKKINVVNSDIEKMTEQNNKFLITINKNIDLINDDLSISNVDISLIEEINDIEEKIIEENQVIGVSVLSDDFMLERVYEKTNGVIRRVNEMINLAEKDAYEENSFEIEPQLIIESTHEIEEEINQEEDNYDFDTENNVSFYDEFIRENVLDEIPEEKEEIIEENQYIEAEEDNFEVHNEQELKENIVNTDDFVHFDEEEINDSMFPLITEQEKEDIIEENQYTEAEEDNFEVHNEQELKENIVNTDDFVHFDEEEINDSMFPLIEEETEKININSNSEIFQEIIPFESAALFSERYEDSELNEVRKNNDSLSHEELLHLNDHKVETEFVYDALDKNDEEKETNNEEKEDTIVEESMPEAFWITQEETEETKEEENILSFDEQIDYLMNDNSDNSKIRKLVA